MRIVFLSNFLNHHQMPLCDSFRRIPGVEFTFVATESVPGERIQLGYKHEFSHLPYYVEAIDREDREQAEKICFDCDVLIFGSAPMSLVRRRLRSHKLTFGYNERWFKDGFWRHPGDIYRAVRDYTRFNNKNFYQLCSSAYTASDSNRVFAFPKRKLRWGYFPEVKRYASVERVMDQKTPASILWVGRLLDWKHPEAAIEVAKNLRAEGIPFTLDMIGNGTLENHLRKVIAEENLETCVRLLGSMSPEQVRCHMERSQIFLFTSDFREGWGAVLNEAMNSGCAVVASHAIGAVPYLIRHGQNGYIYSCGDHEELCGYVRHLVSDKAVSWRLGANAYRTIAEKWNSDLAAKRLCAFSEAMLSKTRIPVYPDGPVSQDVGKVKNHGKFKREEY